MVKWKRTKNPDRPDWDDHFFTKSVSFFSLIGYFKRIRVVKYPGFDHYTIWITKSFTLNDGYMKRKSLGFNISSFLWRNFFHWFEYHEKNMGVDDHIEKYPFLSEFSKRAKRNERLNEILE